MHAALFSLFLVASTVSAGALPVRQASNTTSIPVHTTAQYEPVFAPLPVTTARPHPTTPLYPAFGPMPPTETPTPSVHSSTVTIHATVSTFSAVPVGLPPSAVASSVSSSTPVISAPVGSSAPVSSSAPAAAPIPFGPGAPGAPGGPGAPGAPGSAGSSVVIPFAPTTAAPATTAAPVTIAAPATTTAVAAATHPVAQAVANNSSTAAASIPTIAGNTGYFTCSVASYLYCCPTALVVTNPTVAGEYGGSNCTFTANIATAEMDFAACATTIDDAVPLCCSSHPGLTGGVTIPNNCSLAVSHVPPVTRSTPIYVARATVW